VDELLAGGLREGHLTELYGEPASGKTQVLTKSASKDLVFACVIAQATYAEVCRVVLFWVHTCLSVVSPDCLFPGHKWLLLLVFRMMCVTAAVCYGSSGSSHERGAGHICGHHRFILRQTGSKCVQYITVQNAGQRHAMQ